MTVAGDVYGSDAERGTESDLVESESNCFVFNERKTRLVAKDGSSRYFDNGIFSKIDNELSRHQEHDTVEEQNEIIPEGDETRLESLEDSNLILGLYPKPEHFASLHPDFKSLHRLFGIYGDRVDPLLKILHLPSFETAITTALRTPNEVSKSLGALMFSFYLVTVASLDEDECIPLFGISKAFALVRYRTAARHALAAAEFLKTSNLVTLQAFVMFNMGIRGCYSSGSQYMLSGIAVRLARRMGLHRDGISLGLSPFETESRRRLWFHIVHVDWRVSDSSGTKPSMDLFYADTKSPLNIEDEDISPNTIITPSERTGITSVALCLLRCDMLASLRRSIPQVSLEDQWSKSASKKTMTLKEKDAIIEEMEDYLEGKYLRYCDPSNALHVFVTILGRSGICKMKLHAHNPRLFANNGIKVPQESRDIIFESSLKLLDYSVLLHNSQILQKFLWHINTSYLWDTLSCVLVEVRHRKVGSDVDRAWRLIGSLLVNYPQIFEESTEVLYVALGEWAILAWDDCAAARDELDLATLPIPEYITKIRDCRKPKTRSASKHKTPTDVGAGVQDATNLHDSENGNILMDDFEPIESYDFSSLLSYDLDPDEWMQWERLLNGHGGDVEL